MSIMVAVDLLGCTGSTEERAALLHKTIQLAAELKSSLGNMFGFAAVMRALELPQVRPAAAAPRRGAPTPHPFIRSRSAFQISRLEQTWVTLRQRHTEGAILYDKKLKPFLKNINDGKGGMSQRRLASAHFLFGDEPFHQTELFFFFSAVREQRHVHLLLPPHHSHPVPAGEGRGRRGDARALGEFGGGGGRGHVPPGGSAYHCTPRGCLRKQR